MKIIKDKIIIKGKMTINKIKTKKNNNITLNEVKFNFKIKVNRNSKMKINNPFNIEKLVDNFIEKRGKEKEKKNNNLEKNDDKELKNINLNISNNNIKENLEITNEKENLENNLKNKNIVMGDEIKVKKDEEINNHIIKDFDSNKKIENEQKGFSKEENVEDFLEEKKGEL